MDVRPIDAKKAKAVITCELRDVEGFGKYAEGKRAGLLLAKTSVCNPQRTPTLSLNTLRDAIYQDAVAHGLWEWAQTCEHPSDLRGECAQLVWNEALELDEAYKCEEDYAEELADCVIVAMSIAGKLGIDIDAAIRRKMEINKTRPWKHGKE